MQWKKVSEDIWKICRKFEEIYQIVYRKRLEIHSTKVYNMLRAVMILHTITR